MGRCGKPPAHRDHRLPSIPLTSPTGVWAIQSARPISLAAQRTGDGSPPPGLPPLGTRHTALHDLRRVACGAPPAGQTGGDDPQRSRQSRGAGRVPHPRGQPEQDPDRCDPEWGAIPPSSLLSVFRGLLLPTPPQNLKIRYESGHISAGSYMDEIEKLVAPLPPTMLATASTVLRTTPTVEVALALTLGISPEPLFPGGAAGA